MVKIILKSLKNTFREFILKRNDSNIFFKDTFSICKDSYYKKHTNTFD